MKRISFSDVCGLTACVLRGEVTNKVMPVTMTLHIGLASGDLKKAGPDDMTFYFNKEDVLCVEYEGKHYMVPKQSQPVYAVGEKVAVAECLKDLGYDPKDMSDGHWRGLEHTLAWTKKSHVSASQCKHFIRITGRQVKRLQDITDEEILHSGVYRWQDMPDCPSKDDFGKNLYGFYKFWDGYETPREAFASMINKTQKKGFWESNPWIILYQFKQTTGNQKIKLVEDSGDLSQSVTKTSDQEEPLIVKLEKEVINFELLYMIQKHIYRVYMDDLLTDKISNNNNI